MHRFTSLALSVCLAAAWAAPPLHPTGFVADLPAGWTALTIQGSGRIELAGRQGRISILPVFSHQRLSLRQAETTLRQAAAREWADIRWSGRIEPVGASALRMAGAGARHQAVASFTWVASDAGMAGYLYRVETPAASGARAQAALARILTSFRLRGGPSLPVFTAWSDPRENAFSLEAPAGWRVEGGLARVSEFDLRAVWSAQSPDGSARVFTGDADVPAYAAPSPQLEAAEIREGAWFEPGPGMRWLVRQYMDGASFAREYVTSHIGPTCQDLTFIRSHERPDLASVLRRAEAPGGVVSELSVGEVSYTCTRNGEPLVGFQLAATRWIGMQASATWNVEHLVGYLATGTQAAVARQVMERALASARINPEWRATPANAASGLASGPLNEISKKINNSYWGRRQASSLVDDVDSETGHRFTVEAASADDWLKLSARLTGATPLVDYRRLVARP
jgi:hypothetical protein